MGTTIAIGIGVALWFGDEMEAGREAGAKFGTGKDTNECDVHTKSSLPSCASWDMGCIIHETTFFKGCLKAAEQSAGYCEGVPSILETGSYLVQREEQCGVIKDMMQRKTCEVMFKERGLYCARSADGEQ